ncbi:hypothetical protein [Mycobacterium scrofulaceum]|uniref:Uncharacterized protein n=1 Tax=Mycobacterium scrofulaceum TaxID=1783 RepID=A0A1X0KKT9_MYCSC|nr:hypothetical protein [Mycobacterium scrofulaceum]ORB75847.1 hypothetical protein BST44_02725 [Mycobacterium scrofulaceum]
MNTEEAQPSPQELGALRAAELWLLLAGLAGDGERVAAEAVRLTRSGVGTCYVLGSLTARAAKALERDYGSAEAALAALESELVAAELQAAQDAE